MGGEAIFSHLSSTLSTLSPHTSPHTSAPWHQGPLLWDARHKDPEKLWLGRRPDDMRSLAATIVTFHPHDASSWKAAQRCASPSPGPKPSPNAPRAGGCASPRPSPTPTRSPNQVGRAREGFARKRAGRRDAVRHGRTSVGDARRRGARGGGGGGGSVGGGARLSALRASRGGEGHGRRHAQPRHGALITAG